MTDTDYSYSLSTWIENTIDQQHRGEDVVKSIEAIRSLWQGESWESIQEKFATEGSTWIVWWEDGVRAYIALDHD